MNPFKQLFKKTENSVVGIDIGSSAIKVVQIRKKGDKAVLETYGALALGPYSGVTIGQSTNLSNDKLSEALADLLREAKVSTGSCAFSIPFKSSLMTLMEVPTLDQKRLAQMVPLEARKYIPVPISEVTLDWSIIPRNTETPEPVESESTSGENKAIGGRGKTDVLLVAIHNDILSKYQGLAQDANLRNNFFEIEIFSTMRSVLDQEISPIMIFDMGAASTKIYIVERGVVRNSHTVNKGSQDITSTMSKSLGIPIERAEIIKRQQGIAGTIGGIDLREIVSFTLDFIFAESNRVLLNYQKKYNRTINKVVLVGGGVALKGLTDIAGKHFKTDVVIGNPFEKIEAPAFLNSVLQTAGPEFAVALGVALRGLQEI